MNPRSAKHTIVPGSFHGNNATIVPRVPGSFRPRSAPFHSNGTSLVPPVRVPIRTRTERGFEGWIFGTRNGKKCGRSLVRQIQTGAFYTSRKTPGFLFRIFNGFVSVYSPGAAQKDTLKNHGRYTGDTVRKHTLTHTKQARQKHTTDCISDDKACFIVTYHVFIKFSVELVRTVSV